MGTTHLKLVYGALLTDEIELTDYDDEGEDVMQWQTTCEVLREVAKGKPGLFGTTNNEASPSFVGFCVGATEGVGSEHGVVALKNRATLSAQTVLTFFLAQIPNEARQEAYWAWNQLCVEVKRLGDPYALIAQLVPEWLLVLDYD